MSSTTTFEIKGPAGLLSGAESVPDGPDGAGAVGLPIVLVHGINMSRDVWTEVAELLSPRHRVVTFDLRGHGRSSKDGPFTANDYAADTLAVMDALGIERAHVVGTSFGGSTAAVLASSAPDRVATVASFGGALAVEGLDLDGAIAFIKSVGVRDFFAAFLPQGSFAPGTDQALLDRALDAASVGREVDTVIEVTTTALQADTTAAAQAVSVPALVVTGEHDMTCPVPAGQAVAAALRTTHVVMPERGHVVSMEDPAGVVALIEQHVAAHDA
ncbi:MAG: alpha/beta hydrolase [Actinobacteria bacterium]|nr:alpha/beta hydrolase [Actinomycetota bacterium]